MQKKSIIITISAILLVIFGAVIVNNYKTKTSFKYQNLKAKEIKPEQNKQDLVNKKIIQEAKQDLKKTKSKKTKGEFSNKKILEVSKDDFTIGNKNAPVVVIEYASLSCPHCASFYRDAFARLKKEFIDTNKVLFVYRNFPLNEPALLASIYAECQGEDNKENREEKYFSTIKNLFKSQDGWAFDANFKKRLEIIAKLDGMSEARFNECINNESYQEKILTHRMMAAKELNLKSVPSFFINGQLSSGFVDYVTLQRIIEDKLN